VRVSLYQTCDHSYVLRYLIPNITTTDVTIIAPKRQ